MNWVRDTHPARLRYVLGFVHAKVGWVLKVGIFGEKEGQRRKLLLRAIGKKLSIQSSNDHDKSVMLHLKICWCYSYKVTNRPVQ